MPASFPAFIDHPMAWRGCDITKDDIAFDLSARQAAALEDLLAKFYKDGLGLGAVQPRDCRHRALDTALSTVFEIINAAYRDLKRAFMAEEIDAIDTLRATAAALQFETRLEAREATFLNNYTVMHARSEFVDWDESERKRLMPRLWLDGERNARPAVPQIHIYENEGGRSGIEPQPGGQPAVAGYRAPDEAVRPSAAAE